jgi:hypothetical protein
MTEIILNNRPLEAEVSQESSLHELTNLILDSEISSEDIITAIEADGVMIYLDEPGDKLSLPLSKYKKVQFTIQSSLELALEALESSPSYIDITIENIHLLVALYQQNKTEEANEKFAETIEILDLFVELMARLHKTLRKHYPTLIADVKCLQDQEIGLLSILKAVLPAKEKNDIIMFCDLLEYELIDNLTQWKIQVIPELKKATSV